MLQKVPGFGSLPNMMYDDQDRADRGLIFAFDATSGSLENRVRGQASLSATFTRAGNATYFDESGVMRTAPANTPRFEKGALLLEPAATNKCIKSRDFGTWTAIASPTEAQDQVGIDGASNTAWTIGDDSAAAQEGEYIDITVPNDSNTHVASVFIKKDSNTTRFPAMDVLLIGGFPTKESVVHINTVTGAYQQEGAPYADSVAYGVDDCGSWWRLWISLTNNTTGNTTLRVSILAARGTVLGTASNAAEGVVVLDGAQLELNTKYPTSFIPTAGSEASRTTEAGYPQWNIPQNSLGAELETYGNFETHVGANWTAWTETASDGSIAEAATPITGTSSPQLTCGVTVNLSRARLTTSPDITVTPLSLYKITVRSIDDGTNPGGIVLYDTTNAAYLAGFGLSGTSTPFTAGSTVKTDTFYFTAPANCVAIRVGLYPPAVNTKSVVIDDFSLREVYTPFAEVLGSELVTNGTFAANITGWTSHVTYPYATFEWNAAGSLHFHTTNAAINYGYSTAFAVEADALYKVQWTCTITSGVGPKVRLSGGVTGAQAGNVDYIVSAAGVNTAYIQSLGADASAYFFVSYRASDAASVCDIDNVSVKKVTNAVQGVGPWGTVVGIVTAGAPQSGMDATDQMPLALKDVATSALWYMDSGGHGWWDGTGYSKRSPTFSRNQAQKVAIVFGYLSSNMSYANVGVGLAGATITWATAAAYSGAFPIGTTLMMCRSILQAMGMQRVWVFNRVLTDNEINALR